jgi:hypothetical protein
VVLVSSRVAWQVVDGEAVLIDLEGGRALGLNETASFIWKRLAEQGEPELAQAVAEEFEVDLEQARQDVNAFLSLLRSRGFID